MNTWIKQMGYPVVTIRRSSSRRDTAQVSQVHFLLEPTQKPSAKYETEYQWVRSISKMIINTYESNLFMKFHDLIYGQDVRYTLVDTITIVPLRCTYLSWINTILAPIIAAQQYMSPWWPLLGRIPYCPICHILSHCNSIEVRYMPGYPIAPALAAGRHAPSWL